MKKGQSMNRHFIIISIFILFFCGKYEGYKPHVKIEQQVWHTSGNNYAVQTYVYAYTGYQPDGDSDGSWGTDWRRKIVDRDELSKEKASQKEWARDKAAQYMSEMKNNANESSNEYIE